MPDKDMAWGWIENTRCVRWGGSGLDVLLLGMRVVPPRPATTLLFSAVSVVGLPVPVHGAKSSSRSRGVPADGRAEVPEQALHSCHCAIPS